MEPVKTEKSNLVYKGYGDVVDLPCERVEAESATLYGHKGILSVWEPTPDEREAIAQGANIKLGIWGMEPIPPVSVEVTNEQPVPED